MAKKPFDEYRLSLEKALKRGDSTEHTHRPALKKLLESLYPGTTATNEPERRPGVGAVDMTISRHDGTVGFIETKDIGKPLHGWEKCDQGKRYLRAWPSLILTDYLEFRWFRDAKRVRTERLATVSDDKLKIEPGSGVKVRSLLDEFFAFEAEPPATARALAERLAVLARDLRVKVATVVKREEKAGQLHGQLEAFRQTLIPDLDEDRFADMYAQTLAYGLFAARVECPEGKTFTRNDAADLIPQTNPFLKHLFHQMVGPDLDERVAPEVDYIAEVLNAANIEEINKDFTHKTGREDPVVHFYETFLAAYDPKLRESRGVYYTPEPVVSYIVRSVDKILQNEKTFNKPLGLADEDVYILDPACGTGSFLHAVIRLIHDRLKERGEIGAWSDYVRTKLLKRIFGFELLMAPYAVAHLKLALLLKDLGYDFRGSERVEVYLTNTLEEAVHKSEMVFGKWIVDEANAAAEIKKEKRILVVLGNPPYSGISANKGKWIDGLLHGRGSDDDQGQSYYEVDGKALGERKLWLQDDYVKFIRWGQWRIDRTGEGILAFITNHGYLDNPTFRGMRQSLMKSFNRIHVLDLHGSTKKRERAPDGSDDENVFDIQQGVAIGMFVKRPTRPRKAVVKHAERWGLRKAKNDWLKQSSVVEGTKWKELGPVASSYFFCPRDEKRQREYVSNWTVTEVFPSNGVGIVTARDHLSVHYTARDVWETVQEFAGIPAEDARRRFDLGKDVQSWKVDWAQEDVRSSGPDRKCVTPILYRPFDVRHTYYTGASGGFICRPVVKVMSHMLAGENRGLLTTRQTRDQWDCLATGIIVGHKSCAAYDINTLFPLYLYPKETDEDEEEQGKLDMSPDWRPGKKGRTPNLSPKFVDDFSGKLKLSFAPDGRGDIKKTFGPEDIFDYIYAILHSPTYRKRYAEFLKTDFPRIPLTSDKGLFRKLVKLGGELVALHLMESPTLKKKPGPAFNVKGSNVVEKVKYREKEKSVYINDRQHFEGVPQEVWDFHIGGYQVMQKWLKDRAKAKRKLTTDDIRHYKKIAVALGETMDLMEKVDKAIPRWPIS